jgi:hypothetical protein
MSKLHALTPTHIIVIVTATDLVGSVTDVALRVTEAGSGVMAGAV